MPKAVAVGALIALAASPGVAAPTAPAVQNYRTTAKCAAVTASLQQRQHPAADGTLPDPRKLAALVTHFHDAALSAGRAADRSPPQVNADIARQVGNYSKEFRAVKNSNELHEVQTRLGRSLLGCAFVGL